MGVNGDAGASSTDDIGGGLTSAGVLIALGPLFFCFFFFSPSILFLSCSSGYHRQTKVRRALEEIFDVKTIPEHSDTTLCVYESSTNSCS